ncbi:hypothetical protein WJX74_008983 [Apatococcus lobatus]|uniref:Uncharacterized protein n=1 Tax=Apatococcus lobatus TaxID=904363 RepID=A0AAW1RB22_9CHLO
MGGRNSGQHQRDRRRMPSESARCRNPGRAPPRASTLTSRRGRIPLDSPLLSRQRQARFHLTNSSRTPTEHHGPWLRRWLSLRRGWFPLRWWWWWIQEGGHKLGWCTINAVVKSQPGPSVDANSKRAADFRRAVDHTKNMPTVTTSFNHITTGKWERDIGKHIESAPPISSLSCSRWHPMACPAPRLTISPLVAGGYTTALDPGAAYRNAVQERSWNDNVKPALNARVEGAFIDRMDAHFDKMAQ